MFSIMNLVGRSPDKLDSGEIQLIKDFIIGASRNINNKILAIEKIYNVNIKLAPLPKKVVNVANSDPLMSFPMMTTAHVNTGLHGRFKYPTTVNLNLPFLLDTIGGMGGENYKQRLNKMLEYIKIYKIVKTQLEAYALLSLTTPDEIKKARATVSSQYVEFLPDTPDDIKNIDQFENDTVTEEQIETAAKFFLNPKSTVSSMLPVPPKPPAKPPIVATTTVPGPIDPVILAKETDNVRKMFVNTLYDNYLTLYKKVTISANDIKQINEIIDKLSTNAYALTTEAQAYLLKKYNELKAYKGI